MTTKIDIFQQSAFTEKQENEEIVRRAIRDADQAFNKLKGPLRERTGAKKKKSKKVK